MFNYEEISPDNCYRYYIRKFWILDNSVSPLETVAKYALPNTCFTLAFIIGNGLILKYPDKYSKLGSGNYLVGVLTTKVSITLLPYTKAFMVQLNPWTASFLSSLSFHELTNKFALLADINKKLDQSFTPTYLENNQDFKNLINKILEDYIHPNKNSCLVASCFDRLTSQAIDQPITMTDLSAHIGHSNRSLEKKFKHHVGLPPKQIYTLLRVRSLVNELTLSNRKHLSFTALAYQYGFSDQAHFTKTYSKIMESVPSRFNQDDYILPF